MKCSAILWNQVSFLCAMGLAAVASPAAAQPAQPVQPAVPPPPAPVVLPAQTPDPLAAALAPRPGGLTPEAVARIVSRNKHSVRAKQQELKAAAAKVDQALVNFFPRVSVSATFLRMSDIGSPNLGAMGVFINPANPTVPPELAATGSPITVVNGALTAKAKDGTMLAGIAYPFSIAMPANSTTLQASLALPVSDYFLRIAQGYSAASHNAKAARHFAEAETYQAAADAKIAYFNWVRAKGGVVVAKEAIDQVKAHVEDAKKAFAVGLASKADVLRIEAQLAAAQQAHAETTAFASIAEEQLRTLLDLPPDRVLEIGSDVMNEPAAPPAETLQVLQEQAMSRRAEIRALDETIYSLKKVESVTRAGYVPRIDAFADATYANPNQRFMFNGQEWNGTWDVGVRVSWTLNDTFTTIGAAAEAKARTAALMEQKGSLRDGLRIEVAAAYADSVKAPTSIEAADRGVIAAEESLRVRRELFRNGKATSSELVDAEAELTRARMNRLNAHVGLLVARARLDHATGRDVPMTPAAN